MSVLFNTCKLNKRRFRCIWQVVLHSSLLTITLVSHAKANDNLLAHQLFEEGHYAKAAEIFTDPAWKGVALYKSAQWWRAAEAFVRADDADSYFNLGNCYVQMGYYALALEAYQASIAQRADNPDAIYNADLMRQLLAQNDDIKSKEASLDTQKEAIDQLESNSEQEPSGSGSGEQQNNSSDTKPGNSDENTSASKPASDESQSGEGGNAAEETTEEKKGDAGAGDVKGAADLQQAENRASGGSESDQEANLSQSAGLRNELEKNQATTQWLNQINHNPYRFLQSRIEIEIKRRESLGQRAPDGGSQW